MFYSVRQLISTGRSLRVRPCAVGVRERRSVHWTPCLLKSEAPWESSSVEPGESLDKAYSDQQRNTILHTLNNVSERQLNRLKVLPGGLSSRIVQHREAHGPFLDLNSLSRLAGGDHTKQLCDFMLNSAAPARHKGQTSKLIKPDIPLDRLQAVESIVSIVFGINKMAWAHVDRTRTVRDWQQHEWTRFMMGKQQPDIYLEDVSLAVSRLPQADMYVMEKPAMSIQSTSLFPVMLHLHTLEAMLYSILNPRFTTDREHRVVSMARNTVGKHFEIMVGESKTSGVGVVQRLVDEAVIKDKPRLSFIPDIILQYRQKFQARGQHRNEEMCDALLQALAFYELLLPTAHG